MSNCGCADQLGVHTQTSAAPSCFIQSLPRSAKQTIEKSVAYAVLLICALCRFVMGIRGMIKFAKALFEYG